MKTSYKILFILLINFSLTAAAQDIHFSQSNQLALFRNPSLAGIYSGDYRIETVFRNQMTNINNAYKTGYINGYYKLPTGNASNFFTAGLKASYDKAGTISLNTSAFSPSLSFHKSLSSEFYRFISLGFQGGIVQQSLDRNKITTNSQFDGLGDGETFISPNYMYVDGTVGMSYTSSFKNNKHNNYYLGVAYHHFNKPVNSFYNNPDFQLTPKTVLSGGFKFCLTDYTYLKLMSDHYIQGGFTENISGVLYGTKFGQDPENPDLALNAGFFLRWDAALIPILKIDYAPLSVSLSYDVNISQLKPSSYDRGGFELSISYIGFLKRVFLNPGESDCSKF